MVEEFVIPFIKMFFFNASSSLAFLRIKKFNIDRDKKIIILLLNIIISILYSIGYSLLSGVNIIVYSIYILLISFLVETSAKDKIILNMVSIMFAYISMLIACIISFAFLKTGLINIKIESISEYLIIGLIEFFIIYFFFKIKRFKDGLSFFKNKKINSRVITGIVISIVVIVVSILIAKYRTNVVVRRVTGLTIIIGAILTIIWITKSITQYYKEKMKDRTVEIQAEQLKEKDKIIENLNTELANVLAINHKYNHRISSMERAVSKLGENPKFSEEFGEEYGDILESLQNLSKEYKTELYEATKIKELPKTNIFSIDTLLEHMNVEASRKNINMELKINADINYMVDKLILKNKLETLLGDHIKDAIIAIEHSDNKDRNIMVEFNNNEEIYEIKFYDTGIEFEINTLKKLGLERVTTHKLTGGSGIGFMTTFETLKETKGSLIIEEYKDNKYTKAVIIKFDGKNEYRINSYRADEIKKDERIILKKSSF